MNSRLTPKEAAQVLGLKESTLRTWRCRNHGPRFLRIGGRIFYDQADLDDFIQVVDPCATATPEIISTVRLDARKNFHRRPLTPEIFST